MGTLGTEKKVYPDEFLKRVTSPQLNAIGESQLTNVTFNVRISHVCRRTRAQSSMILRCTLSVYAAKIDFACFDTSSTDTFVAVRAVVVLATLRFLIH